MKRGLLALVRVLCGSLLCMHVMAQVPVQQSLVVAAFPAMDEVVRLALPRWKQLHPDVPVRLLSRSFEDHHSVMLAALNTATRVPDVLVVEVAHLGNFATSGKLEELDQPPYSAIDLHNRFVPYAFSQARSRANHVIALPVDVGLSTMFYRSDLLQQSGLVETDLTRSWESFIASGVVIKAKTGRALLAHVRNLVDVMIQMNLSPTEGIFFDKDGRSLVQTPRFVRAFELALRMRRLGLDAGLTSWTPDWTNGVRQNKVVVMLSGSWMSGHLTNWLAPDQRGLWRVAQLPENTWGMSGGSFLTIPKASKNKALAWEFSRLIAMDPQRQMEAFKTRNSFPALLAVQNDAFFEQGQDYFGGQATRLLWRQASHQVKGAVVSPMEREVRSVIHEELEKVLGQGKDIHQALADAALTLERWAH